MNNLREIKKSRLLHDESFTYMISSNERTNNDPNVALTNFYVTGVDIDGSSASSKEYIELSNFSSYTINHP